MIVSTGDPNINWGNAQAMKSKNYVCGFCSQSLASERGYLGTIGASVQRFARIYICHFCSKPSFFSADDDQTPGPMYGLPIQHIPYANVEKLYNEARSCYKLRHLLLL